MDYWNECIAQACEEAGVTATQEQVASIAASVKVAHENYGTAHGLDRLRDGRDEEIARLKRVLEDEQRKTVCPRCRGSGQQVDYGPSYTSVSQCFHCHGAGKV